MAGKVKDLTGQRFGRLTVIERVENHGTEVAWKCQCDCGNTTKVSGHNLLRGATRSCGCLHKEALAKARSICHMQHGGKGEKLYVTWQNMRKRCKNPNDKNYKNYGGRGILICEEWNDYAKFREWATSNGYTPDLRGQALSIDRIDVNGNYEPSNCRWVNSKVQNNNRRNNKHITFDGETLTIAQWAERVGVNYQTLIYRLTHWSLEKALIPKR